MLVIVYSFIKHPPATNFLIELLTSFVLIILSRNTLWATPFSNYLGDCETACFLCLTCLTSIVNLTFHYCLNNWKDGGSLQCNTPWNNTPYWIAVLLSGVVGVGLQPEFWTLEWRKMSGHHLNSIKKSWINTDLTKLWWAVLQFVITVIAFFV